MTSLTDNVTPVQVADLHELVLRAERTPRSARLDDAIRRWSLDACTPGEVVTLAAAVRRQLPSGMGQVLDRITLVAVTAVSERQVRAALTDPLTGLATRARMADEVEHLLAASARTGSPLTAVMLDVDGLKRINDEQGHAAGDAALAEVGRAVREHLRAADRAYRWGGDEFLLFLPATGVGDAQAVVGRIRASCRTALSSGAALHTDGVSEVDVATWLSEADSDLYRSRALARGLPAAAPRRRGVARGARGARQAFLLSLLAAVAGTLGWTGSLMAHSLVAPPTTQARAPQVPHLAGGPAFMAPPAVAAARPVVTRRGAGVRTVVVHVPAPRSTVAAEPTTAEPAIPALPVPVPVAPIPPNGVGGVVATVRDGVVGLVKALL